MPVPRPFQVTISDEEIADLRERLSRARWPDQVNDDDWSYGTEREYLRGLVEYWRRDFDWRKQETRLNGLDQYRLDIDGLDCHFIHQRSPHPEATPLLLNHGWPGSVVEFLGAIPRLTEPEKFGGEARDAFHVVAPSLPGYGFSAAASEPGMNTRAIARRHIALMEALGYRQFITQGGDWGSMISRHIADLDPRRCRALHLNMVIASPPAGDEDVMAGLNEPERRRLERNEAFLREGNAYFKLQGTRPQTLGYGLNDSPLGLCAWLIEKFRAWSHCNGVIENAISRDDLLTNISLYWFTGTITSSARLYYEEMHKREQPGKIEVPTGVAIYPYELSAPPRSWVEPMYNLVHWFEAEQGGHFAALEQPEVFARDLRAFKRTVGI